MLPTAAPSAHAPMRLQEHAADTYAEFAEQNQELLQSIPPPLVALNYYKVSVIDCKTAKP